MTTLKTSPILLEELTPCRKCGGKIASNSPVFYELQVAQCVLDVSAASRFLGLSQAMGSPRLAAVMGDVSSIAARLEPSKHFVCQECFFGTPGLAEALSWAE